MGNSFSKSLRFIKPNKFKTTILDLPNEILVQIFSKLPQEDTLRSVALVCRRFFEVTRLHQALPIISIYSYCDEKSLDDCVKDIRRALKTYPTSQFRLHDFEISMSNFKVLHPFLNLLHQMSMYLDIDCDEELPVIHNLKTLRFRILNWRSRNCILCNSVRFWGKFPNLTSLKIESLKCYGNHVSLNMLYEIHTVAV